VGREDRIGDEPSEGFTDQVAFVQKGIKSPEGFLVKCRQGEGVEET